MTTLLQVSDAHFGTERASVVDALVELAREHKPDVVVLSGDITQRARHRQFRAARQFLDRLGPHALVAIPGNHDIPLFNVAARMLFPYANYSRVFGRDLEPEFNSDELLVVGVNTTRPRRHTDGELSIDQVDRVGRRLRQAGASQLRVVVVHQPVLAIKASDEANLLHGRRAAVQAWAAAGADIIMGGHIHLPYMRPLSPAFPSLAREVWTLQAGTAVSTRIRNGVPNSVNIVKCNAGTGARNCWAERWDFAAPGNRFQLHSRHELRFAGSAA